MQIYEQYFPPVYQFIRLRVGDPALAEDLTSEVFLKLVDALRGRNAPHHSLRGWIFRVARNVLSSHFGRMRQYPVTSLDEWIPATSDHDPEVQFIRSLNLERARKALRMLNAEQQEVSDSALRAKARPAADCRHYGQVRQRHQVAAISRSEYSTEAARSRCVWKSKMADSQTARGIQRLYGPT